jgi:phosphate acetyltransferase
MLIPTGARVGLTSISLGVTRAIERKGVRLCVFKPVFQQPDGARSTEISAKNRANAAIPAAIAVMC